MLNNSSIAAPPSIRARLLADVQDKRLELPTLPESNATFEAITEENTVNLRKFASSLARDPGIACQLLRIANSAPYGGSQPVGSLGVAIKQLGLRYASELAAGLSHRLVFQPTNEMIERRFRMAVADAVYVGAAAAVLARNYTELSPERARVAGLCHNVGAFPILAQAEYENFTDTFALQNIVETVQVVLSSSILKRWNFPEEVVDIPRRLPGYIRSAPDIGLIDMVVASSALNQFFNHEATGKLPKQEKIRTMPKPLSLLIYEIAGFDPLSNIAQVEFLRDEIAAECV